MHRKAFLSGLLAATAFAHPNYRRGFLTGVGALATGASEAPYGQHNSTRVRPTAKGTAPQHLTVTLYPKPTSSSATEAPLSEPKSPADRPGESGTSSILVFGYGGNDAKPSDYGNTLGGGNKKLANTVGPPLGQSPSQDSAFGASNEQSPNTANAVIPIECGPATVLVSSPSTVYITVTVTAESVIVSSIAASLEASTSIAVPKVASLVGIRPAVATKEVPSTTPAVHRVPHSSIHASAQKSSSRASTAPFAPVFQVPLPSKIVTPDTSQLETPATQPPSSTKEPSITPSVIPIISVLLVAPSPTSILTFTGTKATSSSPPVAPSLTPVSTFAAPEATSFSPAVAPSLTPVLIFAAPEANSYSPAVAPSLTPVLTFAAPESTSSSPHVTPSLTPILNFAPPEATSSSPTPQVSSSAPATKPYNTSPSNSGITARGLVYNTASLTDLFSSSPVISWAYNWDSQPGGTLPAHIQFVPQLWGPIPLHTEHWSANAEKAISAGSTHFMGFNEPDIIAQANLSPSAAVEAWKKYLQPYAGRVKLGSPSVCNGAEPLMGLKWLTAFLNACQGCTIDYVTIHWYGLANDEGVQHFKDHVAKAKDAAQGREVWITEFQPNGSVEEQSNFMGKVLPWLDDPSNGVKRYAYFQVDGILAGEGKLTELGTRYAASS